MPQESKLALIEAAPVAPLSAPPQVVKPDPKKSRAAIKRCCAAWQRAFDAYMEGREGDGFNEIFAKHEAGPVYCKAMPPLSDYDSIRDFIACAAHGILIDAIPEKRANQLLYAAQVALAALHLEPKSRKSKSVPPPPLPKNTPLRGAIVVHHLL